MIIFCVKKIPNHISVVDTEVDSELNLNCTFCIRLARYSNGRDSSGHSRQDARIKSYNEEYEDYKRGRVMKAHVHVQVATELVEVHASRVAFSHASRERQARRAKDLGATIELDVKAVSLLDIDPDDMRTVYSSHLKVRRPRRRRENGNFKSHIQFSINLIYMINFS